MALPVKLQTFEGPLDLLLHLIEKAELDIYDIPIAEITEQYLNYLYRMQEFQIEIASEFVVMAARLLEIKSRMLLPRHEEPEPDDGEWCDGGYDPREELVQQLIEYRKYKMAAELLREKEFARNQVYTRPAEDLSAFADLPAHKPLGGLSILQLVNAFQTVWNKKKEEKSFSTVPKEEIPLQDKMREIELLLLNSPGPVPFSSLFRQNRSRREIVATFLALLELIKQRKARCFQPRLFADIEIARMEEGGGIPLGF